MKFNFKIQQYQTDAVDAVVSIFSGQGYHTGTAYRRDVGMAPVEPQQMQLSAVDEFGEKLDELDDTGYKNELVQLTDEQLLTNIRQIQQDNNIKLDDALVKGLGRCQLDVEMETGTGKTYVYIKTMFELNKRYGWSKFIVTAF